MVRLKEMFPTTADSRIDLAVNMSDSIDEAADILAEAPFPSTDFTSLNEILYSLKQNMHYDDDSKKLKVDEDDIVAAALAYYKKQTLTPSFLFELCTGDSQLQTLEVYCASSLQIYSRNFQIHISLVQIAKFLYTTVIS